MKILITDYDFPDVELEQALYRDAGIEVVTAQCRTEDEVIAAARDCEGLLVQYAPVAARVFAARPQIRIVSRYGAGFDTINIRDAADHGVWGANSPDYGVGEVATHALAMTLALLRHLALYDRDIRNGTWHFGSPSKLQQASDLTLRILGLGRIGKRMTHIRRNSFKRGAGRWPARRRGARPTAGRADRHRCAYRAASAGAAYTACRILFGGRQAETAPQGGAESSGVDAAWPAIVCVVEGKNR
jgi:hypothetical protein